MATRYQRGNQKPWIEEGQTTQLPQDTKGVIRSRESKKVRQHNDQKKKDKRINNDLQNITQKIKDRATQILLKPRVNSGGPEGLAVSLPHATAILLLLNDTNIIWYGNHAGHQYTIYQWKRRYQIYCVLHVSGITFIGYAQYRKIEMYHKSSTDFISIFDLNGWTIMII